MWVPAAHTEQELGNDVSNSKKIPYKDIKKKLHLLIFNIKLLCKFMVRLLLGHPGSMYLEVFIPRKYVAVLSKDVLIVLKFKVDILNNCKY